MDYTIIKSAPDYSDAQYEVTLDGNEMEAVKSLVNQLVAHYNATQVGDVYRLKASQGASDDLSTILMYESYLKSVNSRFKIASARLDEFRVKLIELGYQV